MPPKARFTKEEIVNEAIKIVREEGSEGLSARNLAKRLGTSSSPIFTVFSSMEEIQEEVLKETFKIYQKYIHDGIMSNKYPPYKASGMAYIEFAKYERELFRLLFMRDRGNDTSVNEDDMKPIVEIIQKNTGLSYEKAHKFHLEMWLFVHGIATMIATNFLPWDMDYVSDLLTDAYMGLKNRFIGEKE